MCFARFRRKWNPKGSVINTFATFLLLSYSKLLTVSYKLLYSTTLYNNAGKTFGPFVLYYDASIEYFMDCLAFALVALFLIMYTYAAHVHSYIPLLYVIVLFPFLYFVSFILYKILSQVVLLRACCSRIKNILLARNENQYQYIQRGDNEDLPDRIVNPDMYQPLLPATNSSSRGEGNSQSDRQPQAGSNSFFPYGSM